MLQWAIQMSLVTDSSVNSSSSDDFASFLDAALSDSEESSPEGEAEEEEDDVDDDDIENKRFYSCCFLLYLYAEIECSKPFVHILTAPSCFLCCFNFAAHMSFLYLVFGLG